MAAKRDKLEGIAEVMEREPWRLDLIRDYLSASERWGARLDQQYPHEDMTPLCFRALYYAAMTFQPGRCRFYSYLRKCTWQTTWKLTLRYKRWRRGCRMPGAVKKGEARRVCPPLRISTLTDNMLDSRFYWLDKDRYT